MRPIILATASFLVAACSGDGMRVGVTAPSPADVESRPSAGINVLTVSNFVRTDFGTVALVQQYGWEENDIVIEESKLVSSTPVEWEEKARRFGTSYAVVDMSSYHENLFWILGRAANGDTVIERWKKIDLFVEVHPGQPSVPQDPPFKVKRKELYRGSDFGEVVAIGVDPDSRYLVLIHDSPRKFSTLPLPGIRPADEGFAETEVDHLGAIDAIWVAQHPTLGRVWLGAERAAIDVRTTLFIDTTNNGIFNDVQTVDEAEYDEVYDNVDYWDSFFIIHEVR